MTTDFQDSLDYVKEKDSSDPLAKFKNEFLFPKNSNGEKAIYFAGNSLGLQPKQTKSFIDQELLDWARLGVEGHIQAKNPWLPYHELLTEQTASLVGAEPIEVVCMNSLTVNLHLMMVSFYKPTSTRYKILIEAGAFPSDQYAVASQAKFHGQNPQQAILELKPRAGEDLLRPEDILKTIDEHGDSIALVLLGNVNYLTGQCFDMESITKAAHKKGCKVGFDLAHGAGNLFLELHKWGPDFAVWCSYKYLNAGPGAIAGCFVHSRHAKNVDLAKFCGWWGHNKKTRFAMGPEFDPLEGAESWQLSNPPIFQLAALRSSMDLFHKAGMFALRKKSDHLTGFLEYLLNKHSLCEIITSKNVKERGTQLSLRFQKNPKQVLEALHKKNVFADFREPNIIRAAPAPLYCSYQDVYGFVEILKEALAE